LFTFEHNEPAMTQQVARPLWKPSACPHCGGALFLDQIDWPEYVCLACGRAIAEAEIRSHRYLWAEEALRRENRST
jgi:DNA-directed RNA polymerase subunit RPC12/RpoP